MGSSPTKPGRRTGTAKAGAPVVQAAPAAVHATAAAAPAVCLTLRRGKNPLPEIRRPAWEDQRRFPQAVIAAAVLPPIRKFHLRSEGRGRQPLPILRGKRTFRIPRRRSRVSRSGAPPVQRTPCSGPFYQPSAPGENTPVWQHTQQTPQMAARNRLSAFLTKILSACYNIHNINTHPAAICRF